MTISAGTGIGATFDATGHLIPQVDIGLKALGGIVSTGVFLNLDASADFSMSNGTASSQQCVNANTNLNVSVGAQGSFFSLFNASVGASLFDKDFQLFQVRARSYYSLMFFFVFVSSLNYDRNASQQGNRVRWRTSPPLMTFDPFKTLPRCSPGKIPSRVWRVTSPLSCRAP